tara:strand:- start:513 stop:1301 length:789 start_codon:yes stop_codon:yes gene_type:complete
MKINQVIKFNFSVIAVFLLLLNSCVSPKKIFYLQDMDEYSPMDISYGKNTLQVDDILDIKVAALVPEAALPFNKTNINGLQAPNNLEILKLEGYLVSKDKTIIFPILGTISVSGKTTSDLEKDLKKRLKIGGYLIDPTVTVRLLNSKVTLLGEVNAPGTYTFTENNITFLQALGLAGDLSINGNREDIILIRTIDGIQTMNHLNLTSADWFSTPFQNIKPNDVIVVNPNGSKIKSSAFFGSSSSFVAIASLLISTVVLINSF